MANLKIGAFDQLHIGEGSHLSCGSLENAGIVEGDGTLGLDWTEPIVGNPDDVTCPVIEENVPTLGVTAEVKPRSLNVRYDDIGAENYYIALDGKPKEVMPTDLTKRYTNLMPESTHYVNAQAENSRGSVVSAFFTYTLPAQGSMLYRVIQDIYAQPEHGTHGQNCAFMARIIDAVRNVLLKSETIDSITMNVYHLIRNVSGIGRETVEGMVDVPVDIDSVYDELQTDGYWTRDNGGYNFFYVPNQREHYMFPVAGAYQVEFEIKFTDGNPIKLVYELYVL